MNMKLSTLALFIALSPLSVSASDDADIQARVADAKETTGAFVQELGGALVKEMKANGPVASIAVCRDLAPAIANAQSLKKGWKITRVGTRVRNPMIGTPDVWEQEVLKNFAERAAQGEDYQAMAFYEVVEEPNGKYLRFAKAIGVQEKCLGCHGDKAAMSADLRQALDQAYPYDRATGYSVGDLRGAVSIKQPLNF